MSSSTTIAAGPSVLPDSVTAQAATQAAWRFFNNERVSLEALVKPLRDAGRIACGQSDSDYVLLAHDWSKLDYGKHESKHDVRQLTHKDDCGYDLTTALLVDAANGNPLAPMQMHVKTAEVIHSTAQTPLPTDAHHLDQLQPTMDEVGSWQLPRNVVHVIDREADALGHMRQWVGAGHLFLVRCDDRRVLWNGKPWLISEIADDLDQTFQFKDTGEVCFEGTSARMEVAEVTVVLHRRHKTRSHGERKEFTGEPIEIRLVVARVVDRDGYILSQWTLLTNTPSDVDAAQIALWYYWRWRIESFFKLLKTHGQQIEYWQQETGQAIARRLLVASMACVVIWNLERQDTPQAQEFKEVLIKLSGRRMKRGVAHTTPALLAGYFNFLAMTELLEHTNYDLRKLKSLAKTTWPFIDSA